MPHALSPRLLHADLGQGAEAFFGMLDDPALLLFAALRPNTRDLSEAAVHTDPARFLARRGISRGLVALRLGCPAADVAIGHDARGAPVLLPPDREPSGSRSAPLHLSVSARQDLVAMAFGPRRIGIDLEPLGEVAEPPWNILSSNERTRLRHLDAAAAHRAFLEIWTGREACLKADGRGLLVDAESADWSKARFFRVWTGSGKNACVITCAEYVGG